MLVIDIFNVNKSKKKKKRETVLQKHQRFEHPQLVFCYIIISQRNAEYKGIISQRQELKLLPCKRQFFTTGIISVDPEPTGLPIESRFCGISEL